MDEAGKTMPEECKTFLRENCIESIKEIQDRVTQMMNIYKNNPTFPFDFYNLSLREAEIKIIGIRELYQRMTGKELE